MTKRVLVVDDEPEISLLIKRRLEKQGYSVLTADTGLKALDVAKKEKPDLILLDVMMPELDGYHVCRMLKFDPQYQNIKIIFLTARDQPPDKNTGEQVHADAYITKPFEPEDLIENIKKLLE